MVRASRERGLVLQRMTNLQMSLELWEAALATQGKLMDEAGSSVGLLVRRAKILRRLERNEEALADLNEALRLEPESVPALWAKATLLDGEESRRILLLIRELDPEHRGARIALQRRPGRH